MSARSLRRRLTPAGGARPLVLRADPRGDVRHRPRAACHRVEPVDGNPHGAAGRERHRQAAVRAVPRSRRQGRGSVLPRGADRPDRRDVLRPAPVRPAAAADACGSRVRRNAPERPHRPALGRRRGDRHRHHARRHLRPPRPRSRAAKAHRSAATGPRHGREGAARQGRVPVHRVPRNAQPPQRGAGVDAHPDRSEGDRRRAPRAGAARHRPQRRGAGAHDRRLAGRREDRVRQAPAGDAARRFARRRPGGDRRRGAGGEGETGRDSHAPRCPVPAHPGRSAAPPADRLEPALERGEIHRTRRARRGAAWRTPGEFSVLSSTTPDTASTPSSCRSSSSGSGRATAPARGVTAAWGSGSRSSGSSSSCTAGR